MRITKRQLRKLIGEVQEHPPWPPPQHSKWPKKDAPGGSDDVVVDYEEWVKEKGHITPGSSSVMASYILERGVEDDHELHKMLAKAFKIGHDDVMREMKTQQTERSINMGESSARITMGQLRRLIRESLTSYEQDVGEPSEFVEANWESWLDERGLGVEDLDDLAHYAGGPDRSWLDASPPANGMIGPADLERWAEERRQDNEEQGMQGRASHRGLGGLEP